MTPGKGHAADADLAGQGAQAAHGDPTTGSRPATDGGWAGQGPRAGEEAMATDGGPTTAARPTTDGGPSGQGTMADHEALATNLDSDTNAGPTTGASPATHTGPAAHAGPATHRAPAADAARARSGRPGTDGGQAGRVDPGESGTVAAGGGAAGTGPGPSAEPPAPAPGSAGRPGSGAARAAADLPGTGTPASPAGTGAGMLPARPGDQDPPGTAPWVRCFTEGRRPAAAPAAPGATDSWQVRASAAHPYGTLDGQVFADDSGAGTVLAVLGDRDAIQAGRLVVIAPGPGLTGLCASLHAEQPGLGITLIRARPGREGLQAARRFAAATPGVFREVILDGAGPATEPVMAATEPAADGTFPLGPADVVLLSGITRVGDLACATSLACRGAALAVIAPPGPEDPRIAALLTRLRSAGIRVSRKKADLTDPGQVAAAVRSLERGLGPVTAVVHAAASGPVERCARLSEPTLRSFLGSQRGRFSNVIGAVAMERVRVLVTFGSVAARYGRAGGACDALASGLLAEQAARLAGGWPRCRVLHLDWAPWAEPDHGDQPGGRPPAAPQPGQAAPIPVEDGSRYLLSLLTTADMPARAAVHGRLGVPAPPALRPAPTGPTAGGRFVETVRVHYPGVELVADSRLSVRADPYLADYRIDDLPMLPAAMVLEAMAQTASALAGREQRHLTDVRLAAPVLLLGRTGHEEAVIRVCALRVGDTVETVLRCAETGFRLDHARAVFRAAGRPGTAAPVAGWAAGQGRGTGSVAPGAMVDGTDLYGQVFFQAGRFRRVAFLPEASSRACRALVRGGDDLPWFGAVPGPVDAPLVLGSPGLNDAALHVLQACLPHRRLLATGCESVTFSGREVRGALRVQAVRRPADDAAAVWDVVAADATGQPVVTWQGVRLRDVGALAPAGAWHPALLAISMEARAAEFGLDPALHAVISCGAPPPAQGAAGPGGGRDAASQGTRSQGAGSPGMAGPGGGAPAGDDQWTDRAEGTGPLAGFELTVRASRPVACRWQAVGGLASDAALLDEGLIAMRDQLAARLRETPAALEARLATIASALAALGRAAGTPLRVEDACDAGWIVVRARDMAVACAVTQLSGVAAPVAVALASLLTWPGTAGPGPSGPGGRGERLAAGGC